MVEDLFYMKKALELAKKGAGKVSPNPMVGAVIVKDSEIIGSGYHKEYGGLHAEVNAISSCSNDLYGSTIYVTLEPCCHYGNTPPCTDAIIKSGIKRVVVGSVDNNPLVNGQGIEKLQKHGIKVELGVLREKCDELNEVFFYSNRVHKPFVVMKYGMTVDGKIATVTGESKWITTEKSRENVHKTRNDLSAIMVGIGTVLKDNPLLTCRTLDGKNPIRIICDSQLKLPISSDIVKTAKDIKTVVATTSEDQNKRQILENLGVEIVTVPKLNERLDLNDLMKKLWDLKIDSILLEGGSTLNYSALESGLVDRLHVYIAPKIFGGSRSISAIGGEGVSDIENAFKLKYRKTTMFDEDILIEYDVLT
ncbi:bifunctional diaminohydroxyphosphoribosylaminopyrimidine deaminase/5-amino-6-(5-phosphoribosylamino)uracil reductase RibD [Metaclostridioides mangenotii]|uniref:Riboflavin biosynthesis protein RibD n=1 Tax=Metaclostridioides mangenotii TaxID=1540 RepID=A0ABS4EER0_9FIRM|nr:bifunctional diaminohydroxyphosphoribosylaminopyrimidine deaminase/5-amino-6-(5-phosphoribosylamino)uracil reductase RibD [Clostridioides mangenotii]MBP1856436.1 diaminohydroxyphosphoribosylaminopyrimidine deaminase/5-amino-6-(5-phosphoribosylamino)uracil reductase [Clostridioides mangenotii]